jgi:manganese transport protein
VSLARCVSSAGKLEIFKDELSRASEIRNSLTERTIDAGRQALCGELQGLRAALPFAGPAIIASIAYIDPGNLATNLQAGARYNYDLLSVVVMASLIAMFLQSQSAKLGIVTGRNLAELSREHFPQIVVWAMWGLTELAAMATDLAEFLGAAIGLSLLLRFSLFEGMLLAGVITCLILSLQSRGFRPLEFVIIGFVGIVGISYLLELLLAPPSWATVADHILIPGFGGNGALTLAVGIVGATVMPHAIYLHSGLVQDRIIPQNDAEQRKLLKFSNREVMVALAVAALINLAMVMTAAVAFYNHKHGAAPDLESAYHALIPILGGGAATIFMISLIASGISSSAVGTMAGQVIMQGFVGFQIPVWLRRLLTMTPAFVVVGLSFNPTEVLIFSQVVLSLVLPVPMISLLILTSNPNLMKSFRNGRLTSGLAIAATALVITLNGALLIDLAGVWPH